MSSFFSRKFLSLSAICSWVSSSTCNSDLFCNFKMSSFKETCRGSAWILASQSLHWSSERRLSWYLAFLPTLQVVQHTMPYAPGHDGSSIFFQLHFWTIGQFSWTVFHVCQFVNFTQRFKTLQCKTLFFCGMDFHLQNPARLNGGRQASNEFIPSNLAWLGCPGKEVDGSMVGISGL